MKRVLSLVLVLGLAGCASSGPPPRDSYHRLTPPAPETTASTPFLPGVVQVRAPTGQGLLSERALVWRRAETPNVLRQYTYHQWHRPPPRVLQRALVDYLRAANAAPVVISDQVRAMPDWVVGGTLRTFEHVTGPDPRVAVDWEVTVHDGDGRLLGVEQYTATEPADGATPAAAVAAFQRAVRRLLHKVHQDLKRWGP